MFSVIVSFILSLIKEKDDMINNLFLKSCVFFNYCKNLIPTSTSSGGFICKSK